MSVPHLLVVISLILNAVALLPYIRDTLRGKTKPNQATWFMWALAPMVGSIVAFNSGADPWITAPVFSSGFWPLMVFIASFLTKHGYWKLSPFDITCGTLSFVAFIVWLITASVSAAIVLAIASDFLASIPTLKKLWLYPETETKISFLLAFLSFLVAVCAIETWDIKNALFQVYLVGINFALMFAAYKQDFFVWARRR